jgi:hypothetical protein
MARPQQTEVVARAGALAAVYVRARSQRLEWSLAHSIAVERHYALAWLTGEGIAWDDVETDT